MCQTNFQDPGRPDPKIRYPRFRVSAQPNRQTFDAPSRLELTTSGSEDPAIISYFEIVKIPEKIWENYTGQSLEQKYFKYNIS